MAAWHLAGRRDKSPNQACLSEELDTIRSRNKEESWTNADTTASRSVSFVVGAIRRMCVNRASRICVCVEVSVAKASILLTWLSAAPDRIGSSKSGNTDCWRVWLTSHALILSWCIVSVGVDESDSVSSWSKSIMDSCKRGSETSESIWTKRKGASELLQKKGSPNCLQDSIQTDAHRTARIDGCEEDECSCWICCFHNSVKSFTTESRKDGWLVCRRCSSALEAWDVIVHVAVDGAPAVVEIALNWAVQVTLKARASPEMFRLQRDARQAGACTPPLKRAYSSPALVEFWKQKHRGKQDFADPLQDLQRTFVKLSFLRSPWCCSWY